MPQNDIYFAWPVKPELTAMFLGAGFILRSYFGYHLWRDKYWYTVRWSLKGDYAFLATLFIATWWHISEMNWAEVKVGIRSLLFFVLGLLGVALFALPHYQVNHTAIASQQGLVFTLAAALMSVWLLYAYWKQEQAA